MTIARLVVVAAGAAALVAWALGRSSLSHASPPSPAGLYRLANGATVALVPQLGGVRFVDYRSGALRQLQPESSGLLVGGPGVSVPAPVRVRVQLRAGAAIRVNGVRATRVQLRARTVTYSNGAVKLAARLLLPPGRGPFPAVVIVPGAERAYWNSYDLWADFFASQGFAVLTYDKRGVGDSGGRYVRAATNANLADQSGDALAGVDWLKRQPSINAAHIGLSGGSQAGWVMILAASQSSDVRFAAFQSGPAMSVGRQVAYDTVTREGARVPPPTAQQIHAAIDGVPQRGFDPQPLLAKLQIPMLWQLGSVDKRMYTPETVADLQSIEEVGTHDFTVRVYTGGAHSLRLTRHGLISEEKTSPGFVPRAFPDLGAWLAAHR